MSVPEEIEAARQAGRVEGQLEAIESMQLRQNSRLDNHDKRIATQEKITWGILGAIVLVQSLDVVKTLLVNGA